MVEPVSMSVGVIAAIFLKEAFETAGTAVGQAVPTALGRLVAAVKERARVRKPLERLEDAPDSPSRQKDLAQALDEDVADDPQFASQLAEIIQTLQHRADVSQQARGIGIVQVANTIGDINVNMR